MSIGREQELNALEKLYASNKFEFAVIYGRRRVGKTALINHFLDGKRAIYFIGLESNAKQNLENFSKSIMEYSNGIVGGTPQYLLQINDSLSVEENIKNTFLNPMSFLYEESINLLKQEVREPAIYTAIITAIAAGASRMSEISGKVGEDTNVCSAYIKNLINLGIVRKETPYGEKASRKSVYSIEDNMIRFWHRFVLENNSAIAHGATELVYRRIEPKLSEYMGKVFEDICKQYLWKLLLAGKLQNPC